MKFNQQNMFPYDITEDVNLIKEVFSMDNFELAHEAGVPYTDILDLNNDNPNKEVVDKIYDYAYDRGLYLNDIKWMEYQDELSDTPLKLLSHGSREGIKGMIRVDVSNRASDFGSGFYCGESLKQAGMFVSDEPNGCIYMIAFNDIGLNAVKFGISNDWMLAVAYYRETLSDKYKNSPKIKSIIDKIESADYVIAPIADNRIFETIDMFVNGELTDTQCRYALSAIHLGNQYVFKTQKCVDNLEILSRCYMCSIERASFAHDNSIETNTSRYKADIAKQRFEDKGQYIDELLSTDNQIVTEIFDTNGELYHPDNYKNIQINDNFKKWFANGGIQDAYHDPLIVYHGTRYDFDEFVPSQSSVDFPPAVYFTDNKKIADTYGNVKSYFIKMQKPYYINAKGKSFNSFYDEMAYEMNKAYDEGYDGVIIRQIKDDSLQKGSRFVGTTYAIFDKYNIKSILNKGTWDDGSGNLYEEIK